MEEQIKIIKDTVESILFIAKKPVSILEIARACSIDENEAEKILDQLVDDYKMRALQILKLAKGYIIATRPVFSREIELFLKNPSHISLSHQALETLAIISYRQPVAKIEIENIRGVMSDSVIKSLLEKKLIKETGRSDAVGRPILYGTTIDFLKHFGLNDLDELPALKEAGISAPYDLNLEISGERQGIANEAGNN